MGVFRLILAAAVVIAHSAPVPWLPLVNGGLAVKLFFMVSGFYMALILSGKYQCPKGIWLFYSNRFLRIFPIYWLVLVLELLLEWNWPALAANGGALGLHRDVLHSAGPGALVALLASEVGLLGNEVFSLLGWLPGHGWEVWSSNASEASLRGWKVIFMPHAWTLGCEVAFYLVAPWMNRWRTRWLILLVNAPPNADALPQVLFLVRAWDPEEFPGCTPNRTSHYHSVNEMRAHCVRALRSEFGGKFTGGFSHTDFAKSKYPDCLAPDSKLTSKSQYLELLKRFPICVTSGGLHGSIGWKMGEYVALSKAIVTERLSYQVPSPFEEGENFLAYDTPDGCVAAVRRLMDDPGLRTSMMQKNREYFLQHLRPDVLVLRTLSEALGHHP